MQNSLRLYIENRRPIRTLCFVIENATSGNRVCLISNAEIPRDSLRKPMTYPKPFALLIKIETSGKCWKPRDSYRQSTTSPKPLVLRVENATSGNRVYMLNFRCRNPLGFILKIDDLSATFCFVSRKRDIQKMHKSQVIHNENRRPLRNVFRVENTTSGNRSYMLKFHCTNPLGFIAQIYDLFETFCFVSRKQDIRKM